MYQPYFIQMLAELLLDTIWIICSSRNVVLRWREGGEYSMTTLRRKRGGGVSPKLIFIDYIGGGMSKNMRRAELEVYASQKDIPLTYYCLILGA